MPARPLSPQPQTRPPVMRAPATQIPLAWLWACAAGLPLAVALGGATGLAGRVFSLLGFYEVFAALALSVLLVALAHLLRWRPGAAAWPVSLLTALAWLAAHSLTDAWGFRAEQAQAVVREANDLAEDFVVSGASTPLELVDMGLGAETGATGIRGGLLVQWQAGPLVLRVIGLERRMPHVPLVQALWLAATVAFLTVVVHRALAHLASEPQCARCGRFLSRRPAGQVDAAQAARLVEAWTAGEALAPEPVPAKQYRGSGAKQYPGSSAQQVLRETCPAGHTGQPGWSLVTLRTRGLGSGGGGLLARWPADRPRESDAPGGP